MYGINYMYVVLMNMLDYLINDLLFDAISP